MFGCWRFAVTLISGQESLSTHDGRQLGPENLQRDRPLVRRGQAWRTRGVYRTGTAIRRAFMS